MLLRTKQVRQGVTAYVYANGVINIEGTKYLCHSLTSTIKTWRKNNPKKKKI